MKKYKENILLALKIGIPIILALVAVIFLPRIILIVALVLGGVFCIASIRIVPPKEVWIITRLGQPRLTLIKKLIDTSIVTKLRNHNDTVTNKFPENLLYYSERLVIIIPFLDKKVGTKRLDELKMNLEPLPFRTKDEIVIQANTVTHYYVVDVLNAEFLTSNLMDRFRFKAKEILPAVISSFNLDEISEAIPTINKMLEEKMGEFNNKTNDIIATQFAVEDFIYPDDVQRAFDDLFKQKQANKKLVLDAQARLDAAKLDAEAVRVAAAAEKDRLAVYSNTEMTPTVAAQFRKETAAEIAKSPNAKIIATGNPLSDDFLTKTEIVASRLQESAATGPSATPITPVSGDSTTEDVESIEEE